VKILHLATFLQGGAGLAIVELATRQRAAGHDVAVVTSKTAAAPYGNYPAHLESLASAGVPLHTVDSLFRRDYAANLNVVSVVQQECGTDGLEVVHAHAAVPSCIALLLTAGTSARVIQTMHGWGVRKTRWQAQADLTVMRRLARIVVPSDHSKGLLAGFGLDATRISVVPYGVSPMEELTAAQAADRDLQWMRDARRQGRRIVCCVGTVGERKNQRLLIEALSALRAPERPSCVVVGEGETGTLTLAAERLGVAGSVRFLGLKPHARRFAREADALVLPSLSEGLPLAILEAFCDRVPVIASDIAELTEVVRHSETGFTFKSNDVDALASAIRQAMAMADDVRERMCAQARYVYEARFTASSMVARYMDEYIALLGDGTSGDRSRCAA